MAIRAQKGAAMNTLSETDTWRTVYPKSRVIDENGLVPRRQVAETVILGGKKYYCSLVELEPHATLERGEFMAFPLKRSGEINFNGPVFERQFWMADKSFEIDAQTWKHFVTLLARDKEAKGDE